MVTFKPTSCTLNVHSDIQIYLVYTRGPQKETTSRYDVEFNEKERHMKEVIFTKSEVFLRTSTFYREGPITQEKY
jgi:hypothetical protein